MREFDDITGAIVDAALRITVIWGQAVNRFPSSVASRLRVNQDVVNRQ